MQVNITPSVPNKDDLSHFLHKLRNLKQRREYKFHFFAHVGSYIYYVMGICFFLKIIGSQLSTFEDKIVLV